MIVNIKNSTLIESIEKFRQWEKKNGPYTYDQYNFWSSKYGLWSKGLYHKNKALGTPFVAPVFLAEIFFPASRKLFASKKRFPISDAHLIMGLLNLYLYNKDQRHLDEAKEISLGLLESSVPGYSGYCWGYPFDWVSKRGFWTSGVPFITTTGYCFEAFLGLYDVTKDKKYLDIAYSIFLFTKHDIKDTVIDENTKVCSYSPIDDSRVVNANAYRAFVLAEGYRRFGDGEALEKAKQNINFILKNQNPDGSWLYAVNDEQDAFIDNFHTCFVLKNLFKSNRVLEDERITGAIQKGFTFYKNNLLDASFLPLPFAKLPRVNIVRRELYDYAEAISLADNLKDIDDDAPKILKKILTEVTGKYQKKDGSFVTRVGIFGIKNKIPYIRWPQAQLFYALTNCLNCQ